jgi:hypothetical protein
VEPESTLLEVQAPLQGAGAGGGQRDGGQYPRRLIAGGGQADPGVALLVRDPGERREAGTRRRQVGRTFPLVYLDTKGATAGGKPAESFLVDSRLRGEQSRITVVHAWLAPSLFLTAPTRLKLALHKLTVEIDRDDRQATSITPAGGFAAHKRDVGTPTSFQPITDSLLKIIFDCPARYRMRGSSSTAVLGRGH